MKSNSEIVGQQTRTLHAAPSYIATSTIEAMLFVLLIVYGRSVVHHDTQHDRVYLSARMSV